jgi:peptidyl-prolyl cis-trans isomerase C
MRWIRSLAFALPLAAAGAPTASSTDLPPDILVRNQWMQLSRADYEAALSKVPADKRYGFQTDPKRIEGVLNGLLVTRTLAAQARAHGLTVGQSFATKPAGDDERSLADAELRRLAEDASKAFDANRAAYEARAREIYTLDRDKYRVPEEIRLSDIAVLIKDRGEDAARARAEEARARIVAGGDFAAVAREYSDDPTTRDKGGALPFVSAARLAPDYAKAAFALSKIGEISEPIKGPSAYHVVRLEERRPARTAAFEEVREGIMTKLREQYIGEQRDLRIQAIYRDPQLVMNQPAIDALVLPIDPSQFKTDKQPPERQR